MSHSDFAPSSRARWRACPGSVRLIRALDLPDIDTPYSLEGTLAHSIAADALKTGKVPVDEDIRFFVEYVAALPGATLVEEKLVYPPDPRIHGTPDAVNYSFDGVLEVVDLKFGEGIEVRAEGNPQLEEYAVIAAAAMGVEVEKVRLTVVQPRMSGERRDFAVYPGSMLPLWEKTILAEIELAEQPDAPLVSGPHCQFCKAKPHCPELRQHTHTVSVYEAGLPQPARLHPDQLQWLLENRKTVRNYLDAVEEYAMQQALIGKLPGWKAVGTLKNREWVSEKEARKLFKGKLKLDEYAPRKMLSPAQAEKLVGKEAIALFVKRDPGGPKLVREDAPGEPLNVLIGFDVVKKEGEE